MVTEINYFPIIFLQLGFKLDATYLQNADLGVISIASLVLSSLIALYFAFPPPNPPKKPNSPPRTPKKTKHYGDIKPDDTNLGEMTSIPSTISEIQGLP